MDINQIRELIRAVEESGVGEITIKEAGSEITVRKPGVAAAASAATAVSAPSPLRPPPPHRRPGRAVPRRGLRSAALWWARTMPLRRRASAPFVKVGDEVMAGATLCIVEAMKLMNEIPAESMCVVREVCCENAQPVEFDQVLFYVEPVDSNRESEKLGE